MAPVCCSALITPVQVEVKANMIDIPAAPATRAQMSEAKLPLAYRDGCANLLIPLNKCRHETYFMPWKCVVRFTPGWGGARKDTTRVYD